MWRESLPLKHVYKEMQIQNPDCIKPRWLVYECNLHALNVRLTEAKFIQADHLRFITRILFCCMLKCAIDALITDLKWSDD